MVVCAIPSAQARGTLPSAHQTNGTTLLSMFLCLTPWKYFSKALSLHLKKSFLCNHKTAPWHEKRMQKLPTMSLTVRIKVPLGCFWKKRKKKVYSVKYQICRQFMFMLINRRERRADRDIFDFFPPVAIWRLDKLAEVRGTGLVSTGLKS